MKLPESNTTFCMILSICYISKSDIVHIVMIIIEICIYMTRFWNNLSSGTVQVRRANQGPKLNGKIDQD
jgi:hypothetical protein